MALFGVQMWTYCFDDFSVCVIPLFTGEFIGVDQTANDIKKTYPVTIGVWRWWFYME